MKSRFLNKIKIQKTAAAFLVFLTIFSSGAGLLSPRKADAFATGSVIIRGDLPIQIAEFLVKKGEWVIDKAKVLAGDAADIASAVFAKKLMDYMTDEIIKWIQDGGTPRYVSDWGNFKEDVVDQTGAKILEEVVGPAVMDKLCKPDWAIKIRIGLQKPSKFTERVKCTLDDIGANFDKFTQNFNNGGWKAWLTVSEENNNPYGLYLTTYDEKEKKEAKAGEAAKDEAQAGGGFLSDKICRRVIYYDKSVSVKNFPEEKGWQDKTGKFTKEDLGNLDGVGNMTISNVECKKWEVRTPGKIVADALSEGLFKDIKWLQNKEKWQSYVVAIVNAAVNRMVKEGVSAIKSTDINGSNGGTPGSPKLDTDTFDTKPPTSTSSFYDAWSVQITSSEPGMIFYTLNGKTPTAYSSTYDKPIKVAVPVTLKWFAMDYSGNKEGVHTMELNPPFNTLQDGAPSSTLVAINSTMGALIANKPATIYYTLDGSTPNTSSKKYIQALRADSGGVIKWFAVGPSGSETPFHSLTTMPPFPNSQLTTILDLVAPDAKIIAPDTATANQFFKIDPTASWDNDNTPKIVMYQWDFDNDGKFDWWTVDWNRDGVFDESVCRDGADCVVEGTGSYTGDIGNGFQGMSVPAGEKAGVVNVKYRSGQRGITLRVTDDEGLYTDTTITVGVQ